MAIQITCQGTSETIRQKKVAIFFIGGLARSVILSNSEAMLNSRLCKSKQGAVRFLQKETRFKSYVLCFVIRFYVQRFSETSKKGGIRIISSCCREPKFN